MRIRITRLLLAGATLMLAFSLWGQKPKSPKEIAALNAIGTSKTPDEQIKAIENVLTNFADTEFKTTLLLMAMQVETQKGDFTQTVNYAERLLEADPKNAFAMATLAGETARHTREFDLDKEEKLAKVDKWAKDAIEAAKTMPKVRTDVTDQQWEGARKDVQAQGYEALGMAASLRKKYDEAVADFKQANTVAATQDPATWLRMGQACMDAGKLDDANGAFDLAANAANASAQVKSIAAAKKAEVAKLKAASSAKPATPAADNKQP
jgi:tetratricopeptide (TPR) repeat protein